MRNVILFILMIVVIASCDQANSEQQLQARNDSIRIADSLNNVELKIINDSLLILKKVADSIARANASDWDYGQTKDEMTGSINKWASNTSAELLHFAFPYEGGSSLTLTIRNRNGSNDVLLRVSEGQFLTYEQICRLKFDDGKPMTVGIIEAADNSSDVIFLGSARTIMNKLKTSSTLLVEVPFHQEGRRQVHFNVKNLKWN